MMEKDKKRHPPTWHVLDRTDAYRQEAQLFPNSTLVLQKVFTTPTGEEWDREGLTYLTPPAVAALRALLLPFRYPVGQRVRLLGQGTVFVIEQRAHYEIADGVSYLRYGIRPAAFADAQLSWFCERDLGSVEEPTP